VKDKINKLKEVEKKIQNCPLCKLDSIGKLVFGEGDINAKVMFIGEAPGKTEAQTGLPFVGRSGKLLRKLITQIGLLEQEVYITSPVKYLPKRGTPTTSQITHSREHFEKQVKIISPKVMVLLGSTASFAVLGEKIPVMKRHGQAIQKDDRFYFFTIHPAAALRFQKYQGVIKEDFLKLKKLLIKEKIL